MVEFSNALNLIAQNIRPIIFGAMWGLLLLSSGFSWSSSPMPEDRFTSLADRILQRIQRLTKYWRPKSLKVIPVYVFALLWLCLGPVIMFFYLFSLFLLASGFLVILSIINTLGFFLLGKIEFLKDMLTKMGVFVRTFEIFYEPVMWFTGAELSVIVFLFILWKLWHALFMQPLIGQIKYYATAPNRTIAVDYVENARVSTTFIGDYFQSSKEFGEIPYLFMTEIMTTNERQIANRYLTWKDALTGHKQVVNDLKN